MPAASTSSAPSWGPRAGNQIGGPGGATFYDIGSQLCEEMVGQLATEHAAEIDALYENVMAMRAELERCQELMMGFADREKGITELMNQIQQQALQATMQQAFNETKVEKDTEDEVQRIRRLLESPAVRPPSVTPHLEQVVQMPFGTR